MHTKDAETDRLRSVVLPRPGAPTGPHVAVDDRLGRYRVVKPLGSGGMGTVYAAIDPQLGRQVAIKLLRSDVAGLARARLLHEAKALSSVSHDNVVEIFDVGVADERAYLVMELVRGVTLREWLLVHERSAAEIVEVFAQAGRALASAHAVGILHRDFKPSNVMIDERGRPRVLDFGLAKWIDPVVDTSPTPSRSLRAASAASPDTGTGSVMGTPTYMAPEQHCGLPLDARADQFAFFVALHEALWGQRPFSGTTIDELAVAKARGPRHSPPDGQHVALYRAVRRGLAPDPAARFPDMARAIAAMRAGLSRPRQGRIGALAGVGAALSLTAIAGLAGAREVCSPASAPWDETAQARVAAAIEANARSNAGETIVRVDRGFAAWSDEWLDARARSCDGGFVTAERDRRLQCLERARTRALALVDVLAEADQLGVDRAPGAVAALADPQRCVDDPPEAAERSDDPMIAARADAIRAELDRAQSLKVAGRFQTAAELACAAVDDARELGDEATLAEGLIVCGNAEGFAGDDGAAREHLQAAARSAQLVHRDDLEVRAWVELVTVERAVSRFDDAFAAAERARALIEAGAGDMVLAATLEAAVGNTLLAQGRVDAAIEVLERSVALHEAVLPPGHHDLSTPVQNLAMARFERGDFARALEGFEQVLALDEELLGPDHPRVANALDGVGAAALSLGDHARARAAFERTLDIRTAVLDPHDPAMAAPHNNLGAVHQVAGDAELALAHYRKALTINRYSPASEHEVGRSLYNIGGVLAGQSEHGEAIAALRESLAIRERTLGADNPRVADTLAALAASLCARADAHDVDDALAALERARTIYDLGGGRSDRGMLDDHTGRCEERRGRPRAAALAYARSVARTEEQHGPEHPFLVSPLLGLGRVQLALGDDATSTFTRALRIAEAYGEKPDDVAAAREGLAAAQRRSTHGT